MKNCRKRFWWAILLIIVPLLVVSCGGGSKTSKSASEQPAPAKNASAANPASSLPAANNVGEKAGVEGKAKLEKVVYSTSSVSVTILPLYLGKEKGIFAEEGIDLELPVMKSDLAVAGLVSGQVDYSQALAPIVESAVRGMPVKVLAYVVEKPLFYLYAIPGINSLKDLKEKSIGVSRLQSTGHLAAQIILEKNGIDPKKDVTFVAVGDIGNNLAAMKGGAIQGAIIVPPDTAVAKKMGFKEVGFLGDVAPLPQGGMSASEQKIRENPQQIKKMLRALIKSLQYTREHKKEASEYLVKTFKLDQSTAEDIYDTISDSFSKDGSVSREGIKVSLDMSVLSGTLTREEANFPLDKLIDTRLLEEVQKELGVK